jgi:hypothetical protein
MGHASRSPSEAACLYFMELFADLYGQHAVEYEEHLVLIGMNVKIRSGRARR